MSYLLVCWSRCYFDATGTCSFAPNLEIASFSCLAKEHLALNWKDQIVKRHIWIEISETLLKDRRGDNFYPLQWIFGCSYSSSLRLCLLLCASQSPCHTFDHNFPRWPRWATTYMKPYNMGAIWSLVRFTQIYAPCSPPQGESYLCSGVAVDQASELHVTAFTPLASRDTVAKLVEECDRFWMERHNVNNWPTK